MSNLSLAQILTATAVVATMAGQTLPTETTAVLALQCAVHKLASSLLAHGLTMREVLAVVAPDVPIPASPDNGEEEEGFSE